MGFLGVEPAFGLNNFKEAKIKDEYSTVVDAITTLLFGKPGFFPSMPYLGMDIQSLVYNFWDEISPDSIKANLVLQCDRLQEFINTGDIEVIKTYTNEGEPILVIQLPVIIKETEERLVIGITKGDDNEVRYNYIFDKTNN